MVSRKGADALLVALFLVVISLPLAANLTGFDGADAGAENREMAPFPRFAMATAAEYPDSLSRWFDDHFGFRSLLVRWYGESRLFGLGVSPSAAVVKGRDGWLFYGDDTAIDDYASAEPMTDAAMNNWREAVTKANNWLQARHIAYVFTVTPDKHVLYPEEMPSTLVPVGELTRTDQLYMALENTGLTVDLRPALFAAKERERIFQLTDTHWNDWGALAAYQSIITAVRERVPSTPPAWTQDDFKLVSQDIAGLDLAGMAGLKRVLRETDLTLVPTRPRRARVVEPVGAAPTDEEGRLVTEVADPTLPRAVIFRDSFVSRLVPFLSEHFSRAVYVWQNDFDADLVAKERPDVVLQQIVGRHLYSFIPSPELVPDR